MHQLDAVQRTFQNKQSTVLGMRAQSVCQCVTRALKQVGHSWLLHGHLQDEWVCLCSCQAVGSSCCDVLEGQQVWSRLQHQLNGWFDGRASLMQGSRYPPKNAAMPVRTAYLCHQCARLGVAVNVCSSPVQLPCLSRPHSTVSGQTQTPVWLHGATWLLTWHRSYAGADLLSWQGSSC